MCLWASCKKKYEKIIFFCILKISEERSRIRSWIRIRIRIPNTAKNYVYFLHFRVRFAGKNTACSKKLRIGVFSHAGFRALFWWTAQCTLQKFQKLFLEIKHYTDKKIKKNFLIHKETQSGAVAKSYMRKGFLIYEEMRKYFPIYEEAVSHIWVCTAPFWIFLYMRNIWFSFLSVYFMCDWGDVALVQARITIGTKSSQGKKSVMFSKS